MDKNNKSILINILILVIGITVGYCIGTTSGYNNYNRGVLSNSGQAPSGMHMMSDGKMMSNGKIDMDDMMTSMNAGLIGKTGDAFDQAFLSEMIVHHQGAVVMAQLAITSAKHQEIKDLATGIITAQAKEIAAMQQWQKSWYNK